MKREIGLGDYFLQLEKMPLLSKEEEKRISILAHSGNKKAKERLIVSNLRLVVKIAGSFLYRGLSFPDLIEEGNLGLIHAVDKFDHKKGYRFDTYARWWILNFIKRALKSSFSTIRLPPSLIDMITKWKKASLKLSQELGREPYYEEIIKKLKPSTYFIHIFKGFLRSGYSTKLNLYPGIISGNLKKFLDEKSLSVDDPWFDELDKKLIQKLLTTITEKEASILSMRYGLDHKKPPLNLRRIAEKLKISTEGVRQIEQKALKKLHDAYRQT